MAEGTIGQVGSRVARPSWSQRILGRVSIDRDRPLDTQVSIVTPENIAFSYFAAGPVPRSLSFLLDMLIAFLVWCFLVFVISMVFWFAIAPALMYLGLQWLSELLSQILFGVMLLFTFGVYWFYWGACEAWFNGRTLGKAVFRLRVVTTSGHPIRGWQAMARTFVRAVESLPWAPTVLLLSLIVGEANVYDFFSPDPVSIVFVFPTFLVAFLSMALSSRFQRLGDLVSNTMVVYEHRGWRPGLVELEDQRAPRLAEHIPPGFRVSRDLARALAAYVHKRRYLSPGRRKEIARHLAVPLLHKFGMPGQTSYDLLLCALYYRVFVAESSEPLTGSLLDGSRGSGGGEQ